MRDRELRAGKKLCLTLTVLVFLIAAAGLLTLSRTDAAESEIITVTPAGMEFEYSAAKGGYVLQGLTAAFKDAHRELPFKHTDPMIYLQMAIPAEYSGASGTHPVVEVKDDAFSFLPEHPPEEGHSTDDGPIPPPVFVNEPFKIKELDFSGAANLKRIGDYAFYNLYDYNIDLTLCTDLEYIGKYAFKGNSADYINLSGLTALAEIKEYAFYQGQFKAVNLCGTVPDKIGDYAFDGYHLTSVNFSGAWDLGKDIFGSGSRLEIIVFDSKDMFDIYYFPYKYVESELIIAGYSEFRNYYKLFTYETEVAFTDADGNEIASIPNQTKLSGKALWYEKTDGVWLKNEDYKFPEYSEYIRPLKHVAEWSISNWGGFIPVTPEWEAVTQLWWIATEFFYISADFNADKQPAIYESYGADALKKALLESGALEVFAVIYEELQGTPVDFFQLILPEGGLTPGENTVTVDLDGLTKVITVTVTELAITDFKLDYGGVKREYKHGDKFEPAGLAAAAHFNDGAVKAVDNYNIIYQNGGGTLRGGDTAVTIEYSFRGVQKTALIPVTVAPRDYTGIIIASVSGGTLVLAAAAALSVYLVKSKRAAAKAAAAALSGAAPKAAAEINFPAEFTEREKEVALALLTGKPRKKILSELFIADGTLRKHIENIYRKAGCTSQAEFMAKYYKAER